MEQEDPYAGIKEAKNFAKLFKEVIRFSINGMNAERAAVLFDEESKRKPGVQGIFGFEGDLWSGGEAHTAVIDRVLKLGRADVIQDAQKVKGLENRTKAIMAQARSVLCVPIRGGRKDTRGVIYLDHTTPGFFDGDQRDQLLKLAREFDVRYSVICREGEDKSKPKRLSTAAVVAIFAILLVGLGLALWSVG